MIFLLILWQSGFLAWCVLWLVMWSADPPENKSRWAIVLLGAIGVFWPLALLIVALVIVAEAVLGVLARREHERLKKNGKR